MNSILSLCCMMVVASLAFAQNPDIENYLSMIERGDGAAVQAELPGLLQMYPDNSGVLYVKGVLTEDGAEAVRIYQSIVDKYPKSDWADDALFKVYKFYEAIGLQRTADLKLNQLKSDYPDSKYLVGMPEQATVAGQNSEPIATNNPRPESQPTPTKPEESPKTEPPVTTPAPPVKETTTKEEPLPSTGNYSLQVGAYSSQANANRQKQFFEYHKYVVDVERRMKGSRELFYVFVGRYPTADAARAAGEDMMRSFQIETFVVTR